VVGEEAGEIVRRGEGVGGEEVVVGDLIEFCRAFLCSSC